MKLTVEVKGGPQIIQKLSGLSNELNNFSSALRDTGSFLKDFYSKAPFATQGSIYGSRWQPLSPKYAQWKAKRFPGRGLLERTGMMRRSFDFQSTSNFLRLYNTAPYFAVHQVGGERMPRRVMIQLTDRLTEIIVGKFKESLVKKIRRYFS